MAERISEVNSNWTKDEAKAHFNSMLLPPKPRQTGFERLYSAESRSPFKMCDVICVVSGQVTGDRVRELEHKSEPE